MLTVSNITKIYGKIFANDNISFSAPNGCITIILGPNGAGKSTAIKCIMGLIRYDGHVKVGEYDNKSNDAKRIMGYVPEMPALYDLLTVSEHMEFIARAYKLENYQPYMDELLMRFELKDKSNKLARELSKGMQQKLSICCALLPRPQVVIFDEPFVGLDPHAIKELKLLFGEMRSQGCSLVISTHMIDSIDDIWDRAIIMSQGKIKASCDRKAIEQEGNTLEQIFFRITENTKEE